MLRRGLPRVAGGEPWPPASVVLAGGSVSARSAAPSSLNEREDAAAPSSLNEREDAAAPSPVVERAERVETGFPPGSGVRRGLPRVAGGEPWPPASVVLAGGSVSARSAAPSSLNEREDAAAPIPVVERAERVETGSPAVLVPSGPLSSPRTVWHGAAPRRIAAPAEQGRTRPTALQTLAGLFGLAGLGILAVAAIALVRAIMPTPLVQDFLAAFPGQYELPEGAQPGIPGWVGWQHFLNMFLMVLIIRTGLTVRREKRPTAFWTSRRNHKHKISLTLWLHQALDVLWLANGVIFVVLLFATGHWVRVVPTSWEVFPNALSAALQYASLDWPTDENGWSNYNSLQQLAYAAVIFIAAPLATITGVRMSGFWPKDAARLNRLYPVEWARAVHFPVMLFFVAFIVVHVVLVMATGALRNLNHMYAGQDLVSWTGFWVFLASLAVVGAAWLAVRPVIIAPMAKAFGNVSGR